MKLDAILNRLCDSPQRAFDGFQQMIEDSRLPSDIYPAAELSNTSLRYILLTGATGFLGAYLLRGLLRETDARVCCLVRGNSNAKQRVVENLESYGIWDPAFENRIDIVHGHLGSAHVGMAADDYGRLANSIDAVYHSAASVNWIYPYRKLAGPNVRGPLELLRFACAGRTKAFHYISSCAVGYSTLGPDFVDETTKMAPYIEGIHLGYAQTKCVAESLVHQAGERGLPITIYRPALISGDSRSGRSNPDDFLSRFIKGCIEMGSAPELDWLLDCCPVDFAAESIVKLSRLKRSAAVFHLINPNRRYWHECILWMNLFGYPVRLVPYETWLEELKTASELPDQPLRGLAAFFSRSVPTRPGVRLPQLYEEKNKSSISSARSDQVLAANGLSCPPLSADLLDRYFQSYIATGFLPALRREDPAKGATSAASFDSDQLSQIVGRKVTTAARMAWTTSDSIITELTSWRFKTTTGLFPYVLNLEDGKTLSVMVKQKPLDQEVLDVGEEIARLCSDKLGDAFAEHRDGLEFRRGHLREPAIYRQTDRRFCDHAPRFYGSSGRTFIVEFLNDVVLKDTADDVSGWTFSTIKTAIEGAAQLHGIWFDRQDELLRDPSIGPTLLSIDMKRLMPFWIALSENALPLFSCLIGTDVRSIQEKAIGGLAERVDLEAQLPSTLIHNDFNPRNIALRRDAASSRLCAYDWEMARPGLPQHDLAELLCFVLPCDVGESDLHMLIDFHRVALERVSGKSIDAAGWLLGFRTSLLDLLVNRFAMYAMAHRFRPQKFLGRVMRTWYQLYSGPRAISASSEPV